MKIQIGIQNVSREIELEVALDSSAVQDAVTSAVENNRPLVLSDTEGKTVIVPVSALAYVATSTAETRRVGFGFAN